MHTGDHGKTDAKKNRPPLIGQRGEQHERCSEKDKRSKPGVTQRHQPAYAAAAECQCGSRAEQQPLEGENAE